MIVDTGIGINKEKMPKLFKKFSQIDVSTTKQYGGTGLGLAISKKLTEMMSGEIGVESEIGKGSTFWFTALISPSNINSENDIQEEWNYHFEYRKGLKVLLAEDNVINQKIAIFNLNQLGFKTIVSPNGYDAVNKFKDDSFDLILMDIQMPVMNGYDASMEIRRIEENTPGKHPIPIIA